MLFIQVCHAVEPQTTSSFKVVATIEKGCSLSHVEQVLDFGRHPVTAQNKVNAVVMNTKQSWNIRCTQKIPINIMLGSGEHTAQNIRRMKHVQQADYVSYRLYQNSDLKNEYVSGQYYALPPSTNSSQAINFSIYGVADLKTDQPKSAGIYKDRVAITISW